MHPIFRLMTVFASVDEIERFRGRLSFTRFSDACLNVACARFKLSDLMAGYPFAQPASSHARLVSIMD